MSVKYFARAISNKLDKKVETIRVRGKSRVRNEEKWKDVKKAPQKFDKSKYMRKSMSEVVGRIVYDPFGSEKKGYDPFGGKKKR